MSTTLFSVKDHREILLAFKCSPMHALTSVELREINPDYEQLLQEMQNSGIQIVSLQIGGLKIYKLKSEVR